MLVKVDPDLIILAFGGIVFKIAVIFYCLDARLICLIAAE